MKACEPDTVGRYASESLTELLETMLQIQDAKLLEPWVRDEFEPAEVTSFVGFTGEVRGGVAIQATVEVGRHIAATLLESGDPDLSDDEIRDACGEVANMVAGGVKARLEAEGVRADISVPLTVLVNTPVFVHYPVLSDVVSVGVEWPVGALRVVCVLAPA